MIVILSFLDVIFLTRAPGPCSLAEDLFKSFTLLFSRNQKHSRKSEARKIVRLPSVSESDVLIVDNSDLPVDDLTNDWIEAQQRLAFFAQI